MFLSLFSFVSLPCYFVFCVPGYLFLLSLLIFCCPSLFCFCPPLIVCCPALAPGLRFSLQHPTPWSSALRRRPPAFVPDAVSRCQVRLLAPEPPVPSLQLAATGSRLAVSNSNRSHRYSTECIPKQLLAVEVLAVLVRTWSGIRAHLHPAYHLQFRVQAR